LNKCSGAVNVMVADSYHCSCFLLADLIARGVNFVLEQLGARATDVRAGEKLGPRVHRVQCLRPALRPDWMSKPEYARVTGETTVREVKVGKKILVTSSLKPSDVRKRDPDTFFRLRWHLELDPLDPNTTLAMEKPSCERPSICGKGLLVYMLAYNLIRLLMAQPTSLAGLLPRHISFKHTVQVWPAWSGREFLSEAQEDIGALFNSVVQISRRDAEPPEIILSDYHPDWAYKKRLSVS
jgi:hypothetical protein